MSIYDDHKPPAGEGGGLYLKIADGESVKLRIASEPAIFDSLNERDGEKSLNTRYGWLVYNQESKQPQILQQGVRFFRQIAALAQDEEWGDPTGYDIRVTRQGSGTDTTYTVMPSSNRSSLTPEAKEALDKINLIEKLDAGPFSQRVMWLSDFDIKTNEREGNHSKEVESLKAIGDSKKAEVNDEPVIEDIGDEAMNLDDIPWD